MHLIFGLTQNHPNDDNNLSEGTTSFYFVADGKEHTFYPFYWNTRARHVLGIYYMPDESDPDNIIMQDLYYSKSGELLVQNASAQVCNPEIKDFQYEKGEVRMFCANKYTLNDWMQVFPGFHTTIEEYNNSYSNFIEWKDKDGNLLFDSNLSDSGIIKLYNEEDAIFKTKNGYISRVQFKHWKFTMSETVTKDYEPEDVKNFDRNGFEPVDPGQIEAYNGADFICTRGITYKLTAGTKYGFYIKVRSDGKEDAFYTTSEADGTKTPKDIKDQEYDYILFSQASRNASYVDSKLVEGKNEDVNKDIRENTWKYPDPNDKTKPADWWDDTKYTEKDQYAYASWGSVNVGGKDYAMFAFEDWSASHGGNPDLNDLMFMFETGEAPSDVHDEIEEEKNPDPVDKPYSWVIACEDLGVYDWDFNDVVFEVSVLVKDGKKEVTVTGLASGGTIPVYLMFNNPDDNKTYVVGTEFHGWWGRSSNSPINVTTSEVSGNYKSPSVKLGSFDNFTITEDTSMPHSDVKNMGGFWVLAVKSGHNDFQSGLQTDKLTDVTGNIPDNKSIQFIEPPLQRGEAPQMILVKGPWAWPKESHHINDAHTGFTDWAASKNNLGWLNNNDWTHAVKNPDVK